MLQVKNVTVKFGDHIAVEHATLCAPARSVTYLAGGNGAGKSTLLRAIAGLEPLAAGSVEIDGRRRGSAERSVAYAPAVPALYDTLSVREHAAFVATLGGPSRASTLDRLGSYGLGRHLDALTRDLSFGTRRKASLVLTTWAEAPVILLDEPLDGLDTASVRVFVDELRAWRDDGAAILVTAHAPSPLIGLVDRVVAVDAGRVAFTSATPQDVRAAMARAEQTP